MLLPYLPSRKSHSKIKVEQGTDHLMPLGNWFITKFAISQCQICHFSTQNIPISMVKPATSHHQTRPFHLKVTLFHHKTHPILATKSPSFITKLAPFPKQASPFLPQNQPISPTKLAYFFHQTSSFPTPDLLNFTPQTHSFLLSNWPSQYQSCHQKTHPFRRSKIAGKSVIRTVIQIRRPLAPIIDIE